MRKWIPENSRAAGLFIYNVAIDLRTLFCVSTNRLEPEITNEKAEELKSAGWKGSKNVFGDCLVMPVEERNKAIPAIAKALINWRITSNQARTFSLMEILAVAIRAKLLEEVAHKAKPIIDETADADVFITLQCATYIATQSESPTTLQNAEQKLTTLMQSFNYENQT
jgi:hypothetical protein